MLTDKLSICMLLAEPYNSKMPARPSVIEISTLLVSKGHKVIWIMPAEKGAEKVQDMRYRGIRIITLPCYAGSSLIRKILGKFTLAWREAKVASRIIKEEKCNIIQAREDISGGIVASYLKKRHHLPFVFQYSFPFVDSIRDKHKLLWAVTTAGGFLLSRIMHAADLIMPVSEWMENDLAGKGIPKSKMMTLPLGANTSLFSPSARPSGCGPGVIIYIGTLDKLRQLSIMIEAQALVKKHKSGVKLLVLGQGDDRPNLEKQVRDYGLEDSITFIDQVPYTEVPAFIARADIGISPVPPTNLYKLNSPSKMFEYMSMGKPVVANREIHEHTKVLVASGGGVLVSFTAESFANVIIELLDNPEKAAEMGQKGRRWVLENRSYDILVGQVEKRYLGLLKRKNSK